MGLRFLSPLKTGKSWANSNSIEFASASSQYLTFGNNVNDEYNTAFSWSFWIYFNTFPPYATPIAKQGNTPYTGYLYTVTNAKQFLVQLVNNYSTSYIQATSQTNSLTTSTWYHVVITYDGSGNSSGINIYQNAVNQTSARSGPGLTSTMVTTSALTMSADQENAPSEDDFLNGYMAQVSHWNIALSSGQVTTLFNLGTPTNVTKTAFGAHCDHFWPLGTAPDTIAAGGIEDRVGSVNGTPVNGPTITSVVP
jgi:hypothetical protein